MAPSRLSGDDFWYRTPPKKGKNMPPFLLISIISQVIGMIGCYRLFERKGKSPFGGLVVGFVFGVIGLIVASQVLRGRDDRPRSFRLSR
jgi:hypothetical protein